MRQRIEQIALHIILVSVMIGFSGGPSHVSVGELTATIWNVPIRDTRTRAVIHDLIRSQDSVQTISDVFRSGDTIIQALARHIPNREEIHKIANEAKKLISLNRIGVGTRFWLDLDRSDRTLQSLRVKISKEKELLINVEQGEPVAELVTIEPISRIEYSGSVIRDSLWNSAISAKLPVTLILDMADLFGCKIDFSSDVVVGDSYNVCYSVREFPDGETDTGQIFAARFKNAGKEHYAFRFEIEPGKIDYYDADGNLIRNRFLKSPLRFRYISSGFTNRRLHPVFNTFRPHYGIDYAAPTGTPVCSIGDGVVIWAASLGGYGNCVKVKHGEDYVSMYNHLSRYGVGIRKGSKVQQGQIIGYVGATGIATGPHLDFRVMYNGKFINPINLKSSPGEPLPESLKGDFYKERDRWLGKIKEKI